MTMRRDWIRWLFIALALLYVAPIWCSGYLPTGDGPAHIYNAWILKDLLTGNAPEHIAGAYEVDWRPHPNWSGHLIMVALMAVFPPLIAEKLFVTAIVFVFLTGAWLLATANGREGDACAFLAFPFIWTQPFMAGFYNYVLSLGLYMAILGLWWRRREHPTLGRIVAIASLLIVCYFTHPLATLFACGAIVLLSLLTRKFVWIVTVLPTLPLLAFAGSAGGGAPSQEGIHWESLGILLTAAPISGFDGRQWAISVTTRAVMALLIVFTLVRERRIRAADGFGLLVLGYTVILFWLPAGDLTRRLIHDRGPLFVFLTLLAWFTPRIPMRLRIAVIAIMSVVSAANGAIAIERFRHYSRGMTTIVRAFDPIEPETTFVPLLFQQPKAASYVNVFAHAISYAALERRLLDLANYEPATGYFPIRYHRGSEPLDVYKLVSSPGAVAAEELAERAEYVCTFEMPDDAANRAGLETLYRLVHRKGGVRLYRRRDEMLANREMIVLPLVGTAKPVGATEGARWEIVQTMRNQGPRKISAFVYDCRSDIPCRFDVAPGTTVPIASSDRRFAVLAVPRGATEQLAFATVARRADANLPELAVHVPAVRERAFRKGGVRIPNVTVSGRKVSLRIYTLSDGAMREVTIRLHANGTVIGSHEVAIPGVGMYESGDLATLFGSGLSAREGEVDIELVSAPDVRVWAFSTATASDGRARVYVPATGY